MANGRASSLRTVLINATVPSLCGLRTIASAHKGQVALGRGWLVSVRKRQWVTGKGEPREAWVVDYVDTAGKRRLKTFTRKKKADAFAAYIQS